MLIAVTLWWLLFLTAAGLCIGSFLNVVIYRLPRNRSLRSPLWSACPNCTTRIRWYDNLPILSFFLLRGRCRQCREPISPRYVVVEAMMAVLVLMILDAFFIGATRVGLSNSPVGLTERLAMDWPIFTAHVLLFACLFSMSAIDIENYWVDIRFTNLATAAGFILHFIWTPKHSMNWLRPSETTGIVCLFAMLGLGLTWLLLVCSPRVDNEDFGLPEESEPPPILETESTTPTVAAAPRSWMLAWISVGLLVLLLIELTTTELRVSHRDFAPRALIPLVLFFIMIVRESTVSRPSDEQIIAEIHEERRTARANVLTEFALLLPALLFGLLGYYLMTSVGGDWSQRLSAAMNTHIPIHTIPMMRGWSPIEGLATAAAGYIIGGALGWAVRIVFTLLFGKEAFGTGDIHMMAAAGCVAGWPVVVLGFFLTCGLAMIGWLLTLPFKRSRAVPLGPWLALSFLAVVVFYEPIVRFEPIARTLEAITFLTREKTQPRWIEIKP